MLPRSQAPRPNPATAGAGGNPGKEEFLFCHLVSKPGSKSAFGRRERKWCTGVSLQKPWVKAGLGEASSEPGTAGSCKREHAGERERLGNCLLSRVEGSAGRGRSWWGWKRQEGDARTRSEAMP